jgi:hypothetical protein
MFLGDFETLLCVRVMSRSCVGVGSGMIPPLCSSSTSSLCSFDSPSYPPQYPAPHDVHRLTSLSPSSQYDFDIFHWAGLLVLFFVRVPNFWGGTDL